MAELPHYTLSFTPAQVNILSAGLGELPLKVAGPVYEAFRQQVMEQERAAAASSPPLDADHHPV